MTESRCAYCGATIRRSVGGLLYRDDRGFRFCGDAVTGTGRFHHPAEEARR